MRAFPLAAVALAAAVAVQVVPSTVGGAAANGQVRDSTSFERGRAAYQDQRYYDAQDWFSKAAADSPSDARAVAWLAFSWFRLNNPVEAWRQAHAALALDSCSTVAWEALSRTLNPQFGEWSYSDPDSAWACIQAGLRCDSTDTGLWETVWIGALERGDDSLASRAIRGMRDGREYLSPLLSQSRWMLADLPPRAILLVNGDADCYPTLVVQQEERLRPDVALVHLSLLALPWYRRYVRDRLHVAMPLDGESLDALDFERDDVGNWIPPHRFLVAGWLDMRAEGRLDRPLTMSVTVEKPSVPKGARLCGAYWLLDPKLTRYSVDTLATRTGLMRLRADDLLGPGVTATARSPYALAYGPMVRKNVVAAAVSYYLFARNAGARGRAEEFRAWALSTFKDFSAAELETLKNP